MATAVERCDINLRNFGDAVQNYRRRRVRGTSWFLRWSIVPTPLLWVLLSLDGYVNSLGSGKITETAGTV